jgi:long-chain acyl-CoA synthetase
VMADGLLVIAGRQQAIVNLGGVKLRPELVEEVVLSFAGIEEAAVFGRPNELGIDEPHALVVGRGPVDEAALRTFCASRLPGVFVPVRFLAVKSLPKNAMGKIERSRLLEVARGLAD